MELKPLPKRTEKELIPVIKQSLEEKNKVYEEKDMPIVNITNELLFQNTSQQIAWEKESTKEAFGKWTKC